MTAVSVLCPASHQVGMCGDGCNDCGALRTAHAGLSLSPAEPSAAAPFTSRTGTVAGAPELVREGRAALVASFALFKNVFSTGLVIMFLALILYTVRGAADSGEERESRGISDAEWL